MKIILTLSARNRLGFLTTKYHELLKQLVVEDKRVIGDDMVEITASDLERVSRRISIRPRPSSLRYRKSIMQMYFVTGLLLLLAGLFYNYAYILLRNPIQLALVLSGIALSFSSLSLWQMNRARGRDLSDQEALKSLEIIRLDHQATIQRLIDAESTLEPTENNVEEESEKT